MVSLLFAGYKSNSTRKLTLLKHTPPLTNQFDTAVVRKQRTHIDFGPSRTTVIPFDIHTMFYQPPHYSQECQRPTKEFHGTVEWDSLHPADIHRLSKSYSFYCDCSSIGIVVHALYHKYRYSCPEVADNHANPQIPHVNIVCKYWRVHTSTKFFGGTGTTFYTIPDRLNCVAIRWSLSFGNGNGRSQPSSTSSGPIVSSPGSSSVGLLLIKLVKMPLPFELYTATVITFVTQKANKHTINILNRILSQQK